MRHSNDFFFLVKGDIDEIMDNESGMAPVQLPLSFHALRVKEREDESIALEADIKGLTV